MSVFVNNVIINAAATQSNNNLKYYCGYSDIIIVIIK